MQNYNFIPNIIKDAKTQPIVDYKECLFEKVYVETPVDTDEDGLLDLIAVYIRRPKETLKGFRVPAIYVANPYMMECNEELYIPYDVDKNIEVFPKQNIGMGDIRYDFNKEISVTPKLVRETKGFVQTAGTEEISLDCIADWYTYFNSRGYASVFCGGLGTRGSQGVTITGSREEVVAFKAVIDWLNGRCRAFTNTTDNIEIKADWCTGKVAMTGKSYLGTMSIGVATTGVEGLETIIPEAAISNWYEYDRYNGLVVPPLGWQGDDISLLSKYCCSRAKDEDDYEKIKALYENRISQMEIEQDRESGNYNKFWDERNYLNCMDRIKASVFIIHGLNDWNVKTNQCILFWDELTKRNINRRMILHQGEHIYISNLADLQFTDIMQSWLDYWLYGIENDTSQIKSEVLVQSNIDQRHWYKSGEWSPENSSIMNFQIEDKGIASFVDDLDKMEYKNNENNFLTWQNQLIIPEELNHNALRYFMKTRRELRICGTVQISFEAAINQDTCPLSAMLVDLGSDRRITNEQKVVEAKSIAWGKNTPLADKIEFVLEKEPSKFKVISRGWLNVQNRSSICSKEEIEKDKFYLYKFNMIPMDYTVRSGHKIGLIIYGTDPEATSRSNVITKVRVIQDSIKVNIPYILNRA
ncbi:MAG: Xaa-Pro dipeptidyl-peptidase [Aminipila sp.]